jgi:hypothetical protein
MEFSDATLVGLRSKTSLDVSVPRDARDVPWSSATVQRGPRFGLAFRPIQTQAEGDLREHRGLGKKRTADSVQLLAQLDGAIE